MISVVVLYSVLLMLCLWFSLFYVFICLCVVFFFFQAEDGIRDLVRSRGLGDVYKRQPHGSVPFEDYGRADGAARGPGDAREGAGDAGIRHCLLYTSDAADERSSVDLGGRRIIKKKNKNG